MTEQRMFKFEVNLNRKLALKGYGTADAIYSAISHYVIGVGLTAGKFKCGSAGAYPKRAAINALASGEAVEGFCENHNGRIVFSVLAIPQGGEWNR